MTRAWQIRLAVAVAVPLAVPSCQDATTVGSPEAITGGAPAAGDAAVVALVHGGQLSCTATLIAPRVVLTAAHCLPSTGVLPEVRFGADASAPDATRPLRLARVHPEFDRATLAHDVAIALLDGEAPAGVVPAALPDHELDAAAAGTAIRVVGFGETSVDAHDVGIKREGTAVIDAVEATTFTLHAAPSQPCHGDSGGPAFAAVAGVDQLIGVTSSGDIDCADYGRDTRVDRYLDDFIRPFVAATADRSAAPGDRCYYDAQCAAGACVPASDDAALAFCAVPCATDDDCADGLACLPAPGGPAACQHPPPSPGALGAPCGVNDDCESALCVAPAGEPTRCTMRCFPGALECPGDLDCEVYDDGRGASACFSAPDPGGCRAASGSGELAPLLVLMACGLIRRKTNKGDRR